MEPETQTEQEETQENHNCWACPRGEDEIDERPPVPPGGETCFSTMLCGHRIHTHCLFHFWMQRNDLEDFACGLCNTMALTQEQTDFYNRDNETFQEQRQKESVRIAELWLTESEFRQKVAEFTKEFNTFYTVRNKYMKDKKALKSEYKKKIYIAKQTIQFEKKTINKQLFSLETRKAALRQMNKVKKIWAELEDQYNLTEEPLLHRTLSHMDDAPKLKGQMPNWRFYWTYRIRDKIY